MTVPNLQLVSTIIMVVFALTVIYIRMRGGKRPLTVPKILLPPMAMSTGFAMFLAPQMRFPLIEALISLLAGVFFSYPLILTTHFHKVGQRVYVKRSRWFIVILLALLALRVGLHDYVSRYLSLTQTAGAFFILAFGMIVPWRIAMWVQYRKLREGLNQSTPPYPLTEN